MSGLSRTVVVLAVLDAGWLAFDGGRALLVGDYVTPRSGPHAGQLGSWSRLLSAAGLEPRSTPVKALHLVLGVTWLLMTVCVALGVRWAWWGMLGCAIATLWYLPLGTVLSAAQVALLLRH